MQPGSVANRTVLVTGLSNRQFLERYALAGRIGLSGGLTLIDKAICRAERPLDKEGRWGCWSHAFLFEGRRLDGQQWIIESDIQFHRKHIQIGVQENRVSKYFDEALYTSLLRSRNNLLARERSMYCSAFVQHLFHQAGLELAPGIAGKNTTPEDLSLSPAPHRTWLLQRDSASSRLARSKTHLRHRLGARFRHFKRRRRSQP